VAFAPGCYEPDGDLRGGADSNPSLFTPTGHRRPLMLSMLIHALHHRTSMVTGQQAPGSGESVGSVDDLS